MNNSTINSYVGITSKDGIVAVANVDELLNVSTGDIDEKMSITFYSANLTDIGFVKVTNRGDHCYMKGDFNGRRLAVRFGFAPANA